MTSKNSKSADNDIYEVPRRGYRKLIGSLAVALSLIAGALVVAGLPTSAGIHPALVNAPTFETTGVPAGTTLTPSDSIEVEEDGAVVEGLDVTGRIYVDANNVTIRNSRIDADGTWYGIRIAKGVTGLVIEDSEVFGARSASVGYGTYVARRLNVHSSRYGMLLRGDSVVEDSWIHDLSSRRGIGIRTIGGSNSIIRGNHLETGDGGRGAAIALGARTSPLSGWLIENNVLAGGHKTLSVGSDKRQRVENIQVVNNVWIADSWRRSPTRLAGPVAVWSGNADTDGNAIEGPEDAEEVATALVVDVSPSTLQVATTVTTEDATSTSNEDGDADAEQKTSTTATDDSTTTSTGDQRDPVTTSESKDTTTTTAAKTSTTARQTTTTAKATTTTARKTTTTAKPTTTAAPTTSTTVKVSPPPADGRPWAHNTGPTNVSALKPVYETIKITEPGTVIENVDVIGARIDIQASNVTVRNFRVDAGMSYYGVQVRKGLSNVVIEHGEIMHTDSAGVYCQSACTLRRLYIHDHDSDGMKLEGKETPSLVEYNYITRLGSGEGSHADGNQSVKGRNLTFRYNNFYMPYPGTDAHNSQPFAPGITKYKSNATFILHDETDNIVIEHNWLNGGNYTIYGNPGTKVRNNIFGNDYRYDICNGPFDDWSGNVMEDGTPAGNNQECD